MSKKLLVLFLVLGLLVGAWSVPAQAEEQPSKLSDVLSKVNKDGLSEIKAIDFDRLGDKLIEVGDRIFNLLQKGSVPMLVAGVGIAVVFLFLGIFIGRMIKMGIIGIIISFAVYYLINYMPETVATLKETISGLLR